jgi:hypothetical protein
VLLSIGIGLALASGALLVWTTVRAGARPYPRYGWACLAAMAVLETLLAARIEWVATFFTAFIWTAYLGAADAAVWRLSGQSPLHKPRAFAANFLISIPIWLIFEAFNVSLRNWVYVGVPRQFWMLWLGGAWAFATIVPAILETALLLHHGGLQRMRISPIEISRRSANVLILVGVALLATPLVMPRAWAPFWFGPVWVGFAFVLDPINERLGQPSLMAGLRRGRPAWLWALLASGAVCGFFWEFWNYWASARWLYVFPILQRFRIFAMPAPGFLGFPPFALECFTMALFVSWAGLPPDLQTGELLPAMDRDS